MVKILSIICILFILGCDCHPDCQIHRRCMTDCRDQNKCNRITDDLMKNFMKHVDNNINNPIPFNFESEYQKLLKEQNEKE